MPCARNQANYPGSQVIDLKEPTTTLPTITFPNYILNICFTPIDKCGPYPHRGTFSLQQRNRDCYRKPQLVNMRSYETQSQLIHLPHSPCIRNHYPWGVRKIVRSRGTERSLWYCISETYQKRHPWSVSNDCLSVTWTRTPRDMLMRM